MPFDRRQTLTLIAGLAGGLLVSRAESAALKAFAASDEQSTLTVDHGPWDSMLRAYVSPDATGLNRVAYSRWKAADRRRLEAYLAALQATPVSRLNRAEQYAFWVNLYNARTVAVVLDHYPVRSIRDIGLGGSLFGRGPWSATLLTVEGTGLSLDDVENRILRPIWRDPRIHYAINCASIGCPNLAMRAYTARGAEAMLDQGARAYVAHPRGVSVDGGVVTASKIYDWFAEDFGDEGALRRHWQRYAPTPKREQLQTATRIGGYAYDWTLNDAG